MTSPQTHRYDAIVIGSGPGGEGAAMMLAKSGKNVALVERHGQVGGGCTHWGTIPSKTLRHAVQRLAEFRTDPLFRRLAGPAEVSYPRLLETAGAVIQQQTNMRETFYFRNDVTLHDGHARFLDAHTIEVERADGNIEHCAAEHIVIATGSRPYHPPDVDFAHPRVRDSDTILQLERSFRSVTIYGAGVIGCEYASILGTLGLKVNLVNTRDRLLAYLDDEITDALGYHLRNHGVVIRHQEEYESVEPREDGIVLHCKSGKGFKTDLLLWANGRSGNTRDLGLERIGIEVDHREQVGVNDVYQTAVENVYAVGDVIGPPALASASYDQGRFAATHIVEGKCDWSLMEQIPTGIYTTPEISSVGATERELTERKVPYEVGRAMFRSIARAQITGHTVGMVKLLFHTETLQILGIHCFGHGAAEIVHIGQAIMSQKGEANTLRYFIETTFNYPTMAEAYRVAALNGLNRLS
ncbi:MAG: Si-specific NAD(P)(+) transhydrogenase [Gammaproteobacteria bacterium]|nr:Si-specific NAD(P)(+) transhydrogenase [Gammaproteobacteria bacterium]